MASVQISGYVTAKNVTGAKREAVVAFFAVSAVEQPNRVYPPT
jgi:hypothetical protein